MTSLHKVGLAGLYMSLRAFEHRPLIASMDGKQSALERLRSAAGCGNAEHPWTVDSTQVTLRWKSDAPTFFAVLFEESFRLTKDGLLWFPALGDPTHFSHAAFILQDAVLNTILQHGGTRKADPTTKPKGTLTIEIDEQPRPFSFRTIYKYAHQDPGKDFKPSNLTKLSGWLLPGGAERHTALPGTTLEATAPQALALRYLAVGALYFAIRPRVIKNRIKPRYALVVPDIANFDLYAKARRLLLSAGIKELTASGTTEAGLRVLTELDTAGLLSGLRSSACRVISFGVVPWSKQQKSRIGLFEVRAEPRHLWIYRRCQAHLEPRFVERDGEAPFLHVPQVPDLVAVNLVAGRPWWMGFAKFIADQERRNHVLRWEQKGLSAMVDETLKANDAEHSPEQAFVTACHEAWHRHLGQLAEKARRQGSSRHDLFRREFERLRVQFARAKNAATIRAAVTDFWSRAGSALPELREHWTTVLSLLDDKNWQKARDLALLSLASYKPRSKDEEAVLSGESTEVAAAEGETA